MQSNTNYIIIKQASNDVQLASDYLTDQVRLFVANGEKKYMDAYFFEANVSELTRQLNYQASGLWID